jgi:hypothetical protein
MRKTIVAILAGALLIGGMSGCAKRTIDKNETGSVEVPGTDGTLQKFCDGSILIYWTPALSSGDDDYEFIVYDGCTPDGKIINGSGAIDVNPGTAPRTEDLDDGDDK